MEVRKSVNRGSSSNTFAKSVADKNKRVASNWQKLAQAIDFQRNEKRSQITEHRNKLLSQREEVQTRTVSLTNAEKQQEEKGMKSFQSVCDVLLTSIRKSKETKEMVQQRKSSRLQKATHSSDKKKASRKTMSFSLNELKQKGETQTSMRKSIKKETQHVKSKSETTKTSSSNEEANPATNILSSNSSSSSFSPKRPKSAFDLTEEEEHMNRRLYSCPTALPRIHQQTNFRPKRRNFSKDVEYFKRLSVTEESWKDVHHCRYLRIQPLKRSSTIADLRGSANH